MIMKIGSIYYKRYIMVILNSIILVFFFLIKSLVVWSTIHCNKMKVHYIHPNKHCKRLMNFSWNLELKEDKCTFNE